MLVTLKTLKKNLTTAADTVGHILMKPSYVKTASNWPNSPVIAPELKRVGRPNPGRVPLVVRNHEKPGERATMFLGWRLCQGFRHGRGALCRLTRLWRPPYDLGSATALQNTGRDRDSPTHKHGGHRSPSDRL